jgi:hypothetical protein
MKLFFIALFILNSFCIYSQEKISLLSTNPEIQNFYEKNKSSIKNSVTKSEIELPFWDDFSRTEIYPDQNKWTDQKVYINSNLVTQMPSIGIATFDAIDSTGAIYSTANYSSSFIADKLTSNPINLNYPEDNSIYISFFYKPQGLGNAPEEQDSLLLQFYAPLQKTWKTAWFANGSVDKDFEFVIIQIADTAFQHQGFRFRFLNYASLGSITYPSQAGNCDFWHIDYVYLNRNRTENDNNIKDIAFSKPLNSLLSKYQAMPWSHYKNMATKPLKQYFTANYSNNDKLFRFIDSLNFYLEDLSGNSVTQKIEAGAYNVPPFNQTEISVNNFFTFSTNSNQFCDFNFRGNIVTASYDSIINNKVSYTQKFRDYYAYDDGTAEAGYGLYGSGTKYGSVAYKFFPEKQDNLAGVQIYFTQTYLNESQHYFWLNIWLQGENGNPETTPILSIEGQRPEYESELNQFHFYKFDEPLALTDTFYVGWTQTTEDMLNVGFDLNTIANKYLFYNISGNWLQSTVQGAVMIRPVFGEIYQSVENIDNVEINIYPNPAKNFINIDKEGKVFIYDIQGKLQISEQNFFGGKINISNLKAGIYVVKIISEEKIYTKKLIVN